jgi:hypothetical protein
VSPASIDGFGVETSSVTLRAEGLPSPKVRAVILAATQGRLLETRLTLDESGIAATELRSQGTGVASISARSPPLLAAEPITIPFGVPWAFLISALLGGAVGGTIRFARARLKGGEASPLDVVIGLLVGLVAAGLGVLGRNVTDFDVGPVANELAVFLVAAGAGLTGPSVLAGLSKRAAGGAAATG